MKHKILYICSPMDMMSKGYISALRHLKNNVYVCCPKTKQEVAELITSYDVRVIFTSSRYGIRQLPVDTVNSNGVRVVVRSMPISQNKGINMECADPMEPSVIAKIDNAIVFTTLEPSVWSMYLNGWLDSERKLIHLPYAGDLFASVPNRFGLSVDVAFNSAFGDDHWIRSLSDRLRFLGYSCRDLNGEHIDNLAETYSSARICPIIHTKEQREQQACITGHAFAAILCGGAVTIDLALAKKYFGDSVEVVANITQLIRATERNIEHPEIRFKNVLQLMSMVASQHSYFNRLENIFDIFGMETELQQCADEGRRLAIRHGWEIEARVSAAERGQSYESKNPLVI